MSMEFPRLFLKLHERALYDMAPALGRHIQVALREPLGMPGSSPADSVVYTVMVRVDRGRHGGLLFRPATQSDLDVTEAWAKRHENTPLEEFSK